MQTRLLLADDAEKIDRFLAPHTPFAYYMRSNARHGGIIFDNKPYQADFFGAFNGETLTGILAHTWIASVQIFTTTPSVIPTLTHLWKNHLAHNPREIDCFIGPSAQIQQVEKSAGITATMLRDGGAEERLYALPLAQLSFPTIPNREHIKTRRAQTTDIDLLTVWRHDFNVEAKGEQPGKENRDRAHEEMKRRAGEGDLFILELNGEPVSFCGAGGFLPDWKVVGPVWTPPGKRSLGYGRAVTAGALLQLRDEGATHAVLFAQDPAAERAYRALGFAVIGDWRLDFLTRRLCCL